MIIPFVPRARFPILDSLPKSYFLGHHRQALTNLRSRLNTTDLIIECRDYRAPLSSTNRLFEEMIQGHKRLIVYTKRDTGNKGQPEDVEREQILVEGYKPDGVMFCDFTNDHDIKRVLRYAKDRSREAKSLMGVETLIVGMPNVGKSSLLNGLRRVGIKKKKAAQTGAQPGITRSFAFSVKVYESQNGMNKVYVKDTPGIFLPYVSEQESMLKLALCGCVKDAIINSVILADYLLYRINLYDPGVYRKFSKPTNEIVDLLEAMAKQTGRLKAGGEPDIESMALTFIQAWRNGHRGRFVLDDVTPEAIAERKQEKPPISFTMAKKEAKGLRGARSTGPRSNP